MPLSSDLKPRLKWTHQLHSRFLEAINHLGGADKATPKSLLRIMETPGLTLYHLKSHLQKYRLGKSQQGVTNQQVDSGEHCVEVQSSYKEKNQDQITNKNLQIAQGLQMQMDVQRKLQDQIEVQKHLQLRIEAQGKYLESVLKKAQETLAEFNPSLSTYHAKSELFRLVSMYNFGCSSSSFSELTETRGGSNMESLERIQINSMESSLTSSENSGSKKEINEISNTKKFRFSVELPLMDNFVKNQESDKKRSFSTMFSDGICVEQPLSKSSRAEVFEEKDGFDQLRLDLNCSYGKDSNGKDISEPENESSFRV